MASYPDRQIRLNHGLLDLEDDGEGGNGSQ
jgi:hypothetical protein